MSRRTWWSLAGVGAATVLFVGAAWAADDDLAVVKRAVAVQTADAAETQSPTASPSRKSSSRRPQWLKIRIVEQQGGGKKEERVSVTVPLGILRLLGNDVSIDLDELEVKGIQGHGKKVRVQELLESLESGESLVEIRDDDADVRIWVE